MIKDGRRNAVFNITYLSAVEQRENINWLYTAKGEGSPSQLSCVLYYCITLMRNMFRLKDKKSSLRGGYQLAISDVIGHAVAYFVEALRLEAVRSRVRFRHWSFSLT
jgi:hypothetical protein